jgi:nucleoside-diphosphate-sugar epimerase
MKVLLVGGSGYVGSMVIPHLKSGFALRVLDPVPPKDASVDYVRGSATDPAAVRHALVGAQAVVYMVIGRTPDGRYATSDIEMNYDLNLKGLHQVLHAADEAGITRAVATSTMSVHDTWPSGVAANEDTPCDARDVYGFTKALAEQVGAYFARVRGMTVVALRLNGPVSVEDWHRACRPDHPNTLTAAPDVASATALALTVPLTGFHALSVSGDYEGQRINCARAKRVLGWEPRERPG